MFWGARLQVILLCNPSLSLTKLITIVISNLKDSGSKGDSEAGKVDIDFWEADKKGY